MQARTVKEFGALLREARIARGETQSALAERVHVTQSAISKVEKGNSGASLGLIFQLLKALDLAVVTVRASGEARLQVHEPDFDGLDSDNDFVDLDAIANTGIERK